MSIIFSQDELDKIHQIQLQMLIEFDRICRKYNIKYIISGGTLLGAVRNGKFIPWDDDIDIRMERREYEKFCEICNDELDIQQYFFQNHKTDLEYPWYYAKIRYIHSKYTRTGQEHLKMQDGIFIDIMPADGLPNDVFIRKIVILKCYILKKCLYASVGKVSEKSKLARNWYKLLSKIPRRKIFAAFDRMSYKYASDKYKYVTSYSFVKCRQKEFTERLWHLNCVELEFEGRKFLAPKECDRWLSMTYGSDYITPPPQSERFGHNEITEFYIEEDTK